MEMLEKFLGQRRQGMVRGMDVADIHHFRRFQQHRHDLLAVRVGVQRAGSDVVALHVRHELEHGGLVGHDDILLGLFRGVQLFREVEGVVQALFIGQAGEVLQILQRHRLAVRQRVIPGEKHMGLRLEEGDEIQLRILENALEHVPVEFREVEDAQLAPLGAHVLDDVVRAGFAEGEFILVVLIVPHERREGVHREGVVLG